MNTIQHNKPGSKRTVNRHFIRHYAQMVFVMFLGMAALGLPAGWALGALDSSWAELRHDAPAAMLLLMAATMTLPMAAWMRRMGHSWRVTNEMNASMIVPTLAAVALDAAGLINDIGTLVLIEHVVMLAAMFAVMVVRPEEYSGHAHHAAAVAVA
jgi:flagellar biosynthetic protein FliP